MARTPASMAGSLKPGQRGVLGLARSWLQHGPALVVRVHAGSLAEVELQLLYEGAGPVARAERAPGQVTGHQHDPRAAQARGRDGDLAQPRGLQIDALVGKPTQDPQPSFARHGSPTRRAGVGRREVGTTDHGEREAPQASDLVTGQDPTQQGARGRTRRARAPASPALTAIAGSATGIGASGLLAPLG